MRTTSSATCTVCRLGGEYRLWYLEDLLELLQSASVPQDDTLVAKARRLIEKMDALGGPSRCGQEFGARIPAVGG